MNAQLIPREDGLWEVHLPDGVIVYAPNGGGMTKEEAERALDNLELMEAMNSTKGKRK